MKSVYCAVRTGSLNKTDCASYSFLIASYKSVYPEGPATGPPQRRFFSVSLCLSITEHSRRFPRLQVVTACFSCSPPGLNFLATYFIFMYLHNNDCHQVTANLLLIIIIIIIIIIVS
jgi:hypothetical protein